LSLQLAGYAQSILLSSLATRKQFYWQQWKKEESVAEYKQDQSESVYLQWDAVYSCSDIFFGKPNMW